MTIWIAIVLTVMVITCVALVYISTRVCQFYCIKKLTKEDEKRKALIGGTIVFGLFGLTWGLLNLASAAVCLVYLSFAWLISDFIFYIIKKVTTKQFKSYYAGVLAIILCVGALSYGWYLNHNIWQKNYYLTTSKNINSLKVLMFADSHIGTTFDSTGFADHIVTMQKENPDIVVVTGDFVDDDTSKEDMISASKALGSLQTKYGIYFVFGNHDSGYYGPEYRGFSCYDLIQELEKNGIKVLQDEVTLIDDLFYIIGRLDFSVEKEIRGRRKSMSELTAKLDKSKYIIVADHQPTDYKNQAKAEVDLVLSGHTHGGQLYPFNQVGKWLKENDLIYGYERRNKTDFIVTSGLSDWAIKFKTGTKSEYVIINITPKEK